MGKKNTSKELETRILFPSNFFHVTRHYKTNRGQFKRNTEDEKVEEIKYLKAILAEVTINQSK